MKHNLSQALLIIAGCLVALLLSQYATFATSATSSTPAEPFADQNEEFIDTQPLPPHLGGQNLELVGQIGGASNAVTVEGNYAYVGIGPRLLILDISDPANLTMVGQSEVLPGIVEDVVVVGSYAYVASGSGGLQIIDIATPQSPQKVGFYNTPGIAKAVAITGSYAYVADHAARLQIINISTPSAPEEATFYYTPSYVSDVVIVDNYAYVIAGGLYIIDITNPQIPQEAAFYETNANRVAVAGNYAYVGDNYHFGIIDITDRSAPQEVASYDTGGTAQAVTVAGNYAYLADGSAGLHIFNISEPSVIQHVGSYNTGVGDVAIVGQFAYLAASNGLEVINLFNPQAPQRVTSYHPLRNANGVAIADDYAYVSGGGLRIINIANPNAPQKVDTLDTPGYGVKIADSYAYLVDGYSGLRIVNIDNPQEVGFFNTPGIARAVAIAGRYAYVADHDSGLRIINIDNPQSPQEVGSFDTQGSARAVAIAGNYAYVTDDGLHIINITNPQAPQEVASYDGYAGGVAIAGNYAYVADHDSGLRIINIADPQAPEEVASYDTVGYGRDVTIAGSYAYVTDSSGDLSIFNIDIPNAPQKVASHNTLGDPNGVAVAGSYVYVTNRGGGLFILRFTGTLTPTATPITSGTSTPTPIGTATATRTSTPTPIGTATNTPTPSTDGGDSYESDDVCEEARPITSHGIMQQRTFHQPGDTDWVSVEVTAGTEYLIEALTPADSAADMVLDLYDGCESVPSEGQDPSFSPDIRLQFVAPSSGTIYLELSNDHLEAAGTQVAYDLSVRALPNQATPGALILVGGRYRSNDPLQDNIHNVTNSVYELFLAHGYTDENIYYLASEEIDINNDGINDVDASPTNRNLELAITEWARDKVDSSRALTIYMISHGTIDRLYLNGISQTLNPAELDSWLDQLENAAPGVNVNVIVEACHAGSFIELEESVSQAGRVVIASTGTHPLAYASENGAYFSDAFISALGRGKSLYGAFDEARTAAQASHPDQSAWLDDNGDQLPNRANDGLEAQQRGFAFANGLPAIQWVPYISSVEIGDITNENGMITARVEDDQGVLSVWADIYNPSYAPPDNSTEEMPKETLPSIRLRDENGDGIYSGLYENFAEEGEYRIVIYASDVESLQGEPVSLNVQVGSEPHQLYLPILMR